MISAEFPRRAVRWLWPATLLAIAPKCVLCGLAYAGLGAALGLGGPEICGASAASPISWATSLAWLGVAGGVATVGFVVSCQLVRAARSGKTQSDQDFLTAAKAPLRNARPGLCRSGRITQVEKPAPL
jgi:hypothetical protein